MVGWRSHPHADKHTIAPHQLAVAFTLLGLFIDSQVVVGVVPWRQHAIHLQETIVRMQLEIEGLFLGGVPAAW